MSDVILYITFVHDGVLALATVYYNFQTSSLAMCTYKTRTETKSTATPTPTPVAWPTQTISLTRSHRLVSPLSGRTSQLSPPRPFSLEPEGKGFTSSKEQRSLAREQPSRWPGQCSPRVKCQTRRGLSYTQTGV